MRRVRIDVPEVTPDEALEIMFHHLGLACAYFEAIPNEAEDNRGELVRLFGTDTTDVRYAACHAFLSSLSADFKRLRVEQDREEPRVISATNRAKIEATTREFQKAVTPLSKIARDQPRQQPLERALTEAEKDKLASHGMVGGFINPTQASKCLKLRCRRQGRGLRVILDPPAL